MLPEVKTCWVVPCLPCDNEDLIQESPNGCPGCGMLEWLCFNTKEEAAETFKKEYSELFDKNGKYVNKYINE